MRSICEGSVINRFLEISSDLKKNMASQLKKLVREYIAASVRKRFG